MQNEVMLPQQQNTNRPPPLIDTSNLKAFDLAKLDIVDFGDLLQRSCQDSCIEFELFVSNLSETQWGYLRVVDGKPKKVTPLLEIGILSATPVNQQGLSADGYVVSYCQSMQCNVTKKHISQAAMKRNKLVELFSLPPPCSKRNDELCNRLLKHIILKRASEGGTSNYIEIGTKQGWRVASNGTVRFESREHYPKVLYPLLPRSILHRERAALPINARTQVRTIIGKANVIFSDKMDLKMLLLFRYASYNATFAHKCKLDFDLIPVVPPNDSLSTAMISAILKNDDFHSNEVLTLSGSMTELKEQLAERNDATLVVMDDTKMDEVNRRKKGIEIIENAVISRSGDNHYIPIIVSRYAASQINPDLCCPLKLDISRIGMEPASMKTMLEWNDACFIGAVQSSYQDYNDYFAKECYALSKSVPACIPQQRRSAFLWLVSAARCYDHFYYPLFGPPTEQYVEAWLSETNTHCNSADEELLNLFGQCINKEIQSGRFHFIKRTKFIVFDKGTNSVIADEDYIYIETSVIEELALNTMQLRSVDSLTDALKANECLHINDHHSKCYRFLVQNSVGESYWLYTYGLSELLITAENRQRINCAGLQRYFLDTSDFENAEILPLGITKDGSFLGKDLLSKCKRNDSVFITGQSGTGKSFCGINLLPSFAMLGHRVICFDVSSSFTRDEVLLALPENVVNTLFDFLPVKQGERLPIDPLYVGDCNGLPSKKHRIVSFLTAAAGKLDADEIKTLSGLVSCMLKQHDKLDTVSVQLLREMLEKGGRTGCKVHKLICSVLDDLQSIGYQPQGWSQFFETSKKIPVILLESEDDSRVHPLLDVMLASLWAWQREHKTVPLTIAIDELKQQTFTNGSPLHSILTEGRKFGAKLIGMTQDYVSRENPAMNVMWEAGIKIIFAPASSHERIASELGFSNVADAGFGAMKVGDLFLKADLFNKIDGTNEPTVIPGRTVKFVDSPLYAKYQCEYGNASQECGADDNSKLS